MEKIRGKKNCTNCRLAPMKIVCVPRSNDNSDDAKYLTIVDNNRPTNRNKDNLSFYREEG